MPTMDNLQWLLSVAGGLATLAVFVAIYRWIGQKWRRVDHFLDDWNGIPARPGVPARAGVMERLAVLEDRTHGCPIAQMHNLTAQNGQAPTNTNTTAGS